MIQIIGIKRLIILLVLITINGCLAAAIYGYVFPEKDKADRNLRSVRGQYNTVQADLRQMQLEFEQLEERQDRFDALKAGGYFSTQDRNDAKQLFSAIQRNSGVLSAVVSVKSGVIESNPEASKAQYKVLMSPIEVEIKAFDDNDVYKYIDIASKNFPGHLSVDGITIKRTREVTAVLLRAIAGGTSPELVTASIRMSWRTMIPEDQVIFGTDTGQLR